MIERLDSIGSERSLEMVASARALFFALYDGNETKALSVIDDAIETYSSNDYPKLTKMDICVRFSNKLELGKCLDTLRDRIDKKSALFNSFKKSEAIYFALSGNAAKALRIVEREMGEYSEVARGRLIERINEIASYYPEA